MMLGAERSRRRIDRRWSIRWRSSGYLLLAASVAHVIVAYATRTAELSRPVARAASVAVPIDRHRTTGK